jgi:ADP-heptose:LPS heptosyltransferase
MFTCGVRDFKLAFPDIEVGVNSNFKELWENNPYINHDLKKDTPGVEYYQVGYPIINNSNNASSHFSQAFLWDMIAIAGKKKRLPLTLHEFISIYSNGEVGDPPLYNLSKREKIDKIATWKGSRSFKYWEELQAKYKNFSKKFGRIRPDVHLSDHEKKHSLLRDTYGVEHYWVVAAGGKRDCTTKMWDWPKFQEIVDHFKGVIQFVTIGRSDHLIYKYDGVIDLVDKFNENTRGLLPLVYHSDGCISGVSFLMHLAAAMPNQPHRKMIGWKPCISIYGGREPITFTNYNSHQILHTGGCLDCCDGGGCWHSRIVPLQKTPKLNKRLCEKPIKVKGRTVQKCMTMITTEDIIRAIERYYKGGVLRAAKPVTHPVKYLKTDQEQFLFGNQREAIEVKGPKKKREINIVASLQSDGGGEQSIIKIADMLIDAGWKVNMHPWAKVHKAFENKEYIKKVTFIGAVNIMKTFKNKTAPINPNSYKKNIPMMFYANDQIWDFCREGGELLVNASSKAVVCINWANGHLPKEPWATRNDKIKAIIFHNREKLEEFRRDAVGFFNTKLIPLFGAIELDKYLEVNTALREDRQEQLVVLKHCKPDHRKYVTEETANGGDKKHVWQKEFFKDSDMQLYTRLIKKFKGRIRFEFMEAHKDIVNYFKDNENMIFHRWNAMPVEEFLSRGHIYFYRTSNHWRDNYPRVVAEALAAGLPVITEPRDGTKDRVIHGDTGFYACHYNEIECHFEALERKENLRQAMGRAAKEWARANLDPKRWVQVLEEIFYG